MARRIGTSKNGFEGPRKSVLTLLPIAFGAVCALGWLALMIGLFAGMNIDDTALGLTIGLLVLVLLAALSTLLVRSAASVVAIVSALLYAGVWTYFRFGFDKLMPDAVLLALTAVFFVSPLVTGISAVVAGLRARR